VSQARFSVRPDALARRRCDAWGSSEGGGACAYQDLHEGRAPSATVSPCTGQEDLRDARARERRLRRFKLNLAAWGLGTIVITALWVTLEWQANGAFERFAHGGNPGDWNPTLWALVAGLWG
jgi:hypothetical protein